MRAVKDFWRFVFVIMLMTVKTTCTNKVSAYHANNSSLLVTMPTNRSEYEGT